MIYKDLRGYIGRLLEEGEAVPIDEEIDWNLEAGAILRRCHENGLPAPLFQKIKGYPAGYRLFGGVVSKYQRIALAMGLDKDTHPRQMMEEYSRRISTPRKPVMVKTGPCKENIKIGDGVNLLEFPVPYLHEGDGGRYIGTFHLTISKDSGSDWVNWGMYRHMMHDKNTVGVHMSPLSHLGIIYYQHYESRSEPMDIAIVIGPDPLSGMCACSPFPKDVSEVDMVGALMGEPVELVKCETIDLAVPASAEIVIEGEIRPHERKNEGPMGEYIGYLRPGKVSRPVIHVKAVTYRNDPILTMSCVGIPVDDNLAHAISGSADVLEVLKARGLPVSSVCIYPETSYFMAAVSVNASFPNLAGEIAQVVWANACGRDISVVVVVNDDVDPFNMSQVLHAMTTKCHPYKGIVRLERSTRAGLAPWANAYERKYSLGSKVYFDCTWPQGWPPEDIPVRVSFTDSYPQAIQKKALDIWKKYGY